MKKRQVVGIVLAGVSVLALIALIVFSLLPTVVVVPPQAVAVVVPVVDVVPDVPEVIFIGISSVSPLDISEGQSVTNSIIVTFDEAIDPATVNADTFTIRGPDGNNLNGVITSDASKRIWKFNPTDYLDSRTLYDLTITTGVVGVSGNSLIENFEWSFTTKSVSTGGGGSSGGSTAPVPEPEVLDANPTAPDLGEAGRYIILASQAVTTTGVTAISHGDIGILDQARTFMSGFTPNGPAGDFDELTNGTSFASNDANPAPFPYPLHYSTPVIGDPWATTGALITQSRTDLGVAYDFLAADPNPTAPTQALASELAGLTLTRGVYKTGVGVTIGVANPGNLTLDAQGDPDSVWVFSIDGTLTTGDMATGSSVTLVNGAQAKNVYWRVADVTQIGSGVLFQGNVFNFAQVNVIDGATVRGRLFSKNEQVTLISNIVTK